MPETVNIEAKNLLAKLLASENIWIQHRKDAETASFDLVNRILTFPMWKDMSDCVYTLLAGHETSHALNTYDTVKKKRVNANVLVYAQRIDSTSSGHMYHGTKSEGMCPVCRIAAMYWNIVEDARIERLIKGPYPGLKSIFAEGYKELFDNDMFGIKDKTTTELAKLPLIDRINIYYKVGHLCQLSFTPDEEILLRKVGCTITMDDVVSVAKEIYEWSKQNELQPPPPITMKMSMDEFMKMRKELGKQQPSPGSQVQEIHVEITDEGEEGDDQKDEKGKDKKDEKGKDKKDKKDKKDQKDKKEKPNDKKGKGKKSKGKKSDAGDDDEGDEGEDSEEKDGKDKDKGDKSDGKGEDGEGEGNNGDDEGEGDDSVGDDSGDADGDGKGGEGDGGDEEGEGDNEAGPGKKTSTGHYATKPVDPGPPPESQTQSTFDQKIKSLRDPNAQEIVYVTLPKPNLKNIVVPFEEVHEGIRSHFGAKSGPMIQAEKAYSTFRDAQMPKIDYILQQFEMRKQAARYLRTKQHKSGSLDTLRLSYYKTHDDLFKTIQIAQDGKNHGLIYVVDWSGSMQGQMAGTLEQLIVLCLFCRKAQIPFEVYSLTTGSNNAFTREPGNLAYAQNFRMRMYLSSRMTPGVFQDACVNLFALMPNGNFVGNGYGRTHGPTADNLIGCTPLDEAIITSIDLIKEFKQKTHAEIVNAIFLTDGGANTVSAYYDQSGRQTSMGGYGSYNYGYGYRNNPSANTKYLIDDRQTHKVYSFTIGDMTPTMVKILRDRNNIHAVCFYIDGSYNAFFTTEIDSVREAALQKEFTENGFVISTEWGFDEVYITKRNDWRLNDSKLKPQKIEVGSPDYIKEAGNLFVKNGLNMMKQRLLLDRFVKMIA
jgi:hypothetical protein